VPFLSNVRTHFIGDFQIEWLALKNDFPGKITKFGGGGAIIGQQHRQIYVYYSVWVLNSLTVICLSSLFTLPALNLVVFNCSVLL
jgi:hypothetical protein